MKRVCKDCLEEVSVKKPLKGNVLISFILWMFFIVPGILYSIWRRTDRDVVCKKCRGKNTVPFNSKAGRKILLENEDE